MGGTLMPIHDWSRVDTNLYHHFHQCWTIAICDELNSGVLPGGFSAFVEQYGVGLIHDLLVLRPRHSGEIPSAPAARTMPLEFPKWTGFSFESRRDSLARRANRIAIRHRLRKAVLVIQIVSPGNKDRKLALEHFVGTAHGFLVAGLNVLVVDPFPPTRLDPGGIHKAIWDEVEGAVPFQVPVDRPLTLASYVGCNIKAGYSIRAYVETLGVGQPLPDMPAYLDADTYVPVPLESAYQTAWERCPSDMRYLVEHGKLPGE